MKRRPRGSFVGNGGQAFVREGRLYPRDLLEAGLHRDPYVGLEADLRILDGVAYLPFRDLWFERTLLAQKLTDIDTLCPELGSHLLRTLASYRWIAVEEPLAPTAEDDDSSDALDVVQVATRIREQILVHLPSWERLAPVHRIALLIHEAVYSLLRPEPAGPGAEHQVGARAREIGAALFDRETFVAGSDARERLLRNLTRLQVPSSSAHSGDGAADHGAGCWSLTLRKRSDGSELAQIRMPLHRLRSRPDLFRERIVDEIGAWKYFGDAEVASVIRFERCRFSFVPYAVAEGLDQFAARICERPQPSSHAAVRRADSLATDPQSFVTQQLSIVESEA